MIKAVFFDFYNTLVHFNPQREEIQAQVCRNLGIEVSLEGLTRGYILADRFMERENAAEVPLARRSPGDLESFFAKYERLILRTAGVDTDLLTASRVWDQVLQIPYKLVLYDDVIAAFEILKTQELTIGVISNINRDMNALSRDLGLESYLDFNVTSREVGHGKPHPPIFLKALERAGVEPHEALHVGDSYASDVLGATGVGIHALLLDRNLTETHVTYSTRISSLMEIPGYLYAV